MTAPTAPIVITVERNGTKYALHANTELWTTGKHGHLAGYVMDPQNIEAAIDEHEDEMAALIAAARREFGPPLRGE